MLFNNIYIAVYLILVLLVSLENCLGFPMFLPKQFFNHF